MYVRMKTKVLTIGMQNTDDARLGTQPFFIGTQLIDGMMTGFKQQVKEDGSVTHYQTAQLLGQRKYQVVISGG